MNEDPYIQACQYMDRLVEELRQTAPKALKKWDADAIHDARVATRRLKAATNLLRPLTSDEHRKPFIKALRTLRRRLGPLRDLDVMLEHLEEPRYHRTHERAVSWISRQLKDERDGLRKKVSGKGVPARVLARLGAWWGLREQLCDGHKAISLDAILAESLHQQLESFTGHAEKLKANAGVPLERRKPDDPHALRIDGKLLRYTLEMATVLGHSLPGPVIAHFKQMQEALGAWHDSVVLSQKVMGVALEHNLASHDRALYEQLLDLSGMLWRQAEHQLKRFTAYWDQQGQEVSATIGEAFPLPVPAAVADADMEAPGHVPGELNPDAGPSLGIAAA